MNSKTIPQTDSIKKLAEFWESHDLTDFEEQLEEVAENVKDSLEQQWERLPEIEQKVMSLLARDSQAVNLAKLLSNASMPSSDLLNALQSLWRRSFIQKQENIYSLSPVMKEYIKGL